jgi:TM2 domain-containing membrane protein YozV
MVVKIKCERCTSSLRAPEELIGEVLPCPKCGHPVSVVANPTKYAVSAPIVATSDKNGAGDASIGVNDDWVNEIISSSASSDQQKTTQCPFCLERIILGARKCKHCGEILDSDLERHRQPQRYERNSNTDKRILVAFLLCFFLGMLGLHRFYVGKNGTAVVIILVTICFPFTIFSAIWVILDSIVIVTGGFEDKNGIRITEWT